MKIAVEGCAHGELDNIYDTIRSLEVKDNIKIDLLICCGDFQATRNESDLRCMAVPPKYYNMCSFYKYYSGEKTAPVLTIFIGGNHEASNYLQELPYGGWVAPNIYYLGYAGVINVAGIRIGGISGIYKGNDYLKGHFEYAPYDENSKRSVYHIRNLEVFRLKQIAQPLEIFISHDWPTGVWEAGDKDQLLRFKPFFRDDIESGQLGGKPFQELLDHLKPDYWFAAHLHCKFAALIEHSDGKSTKFLALDKCLPKRRFLQVIDITHNSSDKFKINYDLEWLTILHSTNHLLSTKRTLNYMPGPSGLERWSFAPTEEEMCNIKLKYDNNLEVPDNFIKTAEAYQPDNPKGKGVTQPHSQINPQTTDFCNKLGIDDPLFLVCKSQNINNSMIEKEICNEVTSDINQGAERRTSMKLKLSLPEPVNSSCEDSILTFDTDDSVAVENSFIIDTAGSDTSELQSPRPKKFVRRNADIYVDQ